MAVSEGDEMSIKRRGVNTYLVRIYLGRDPLTRKRIQSNCTVRGTLATAKKLEAKLKSEKELGHLYKTPRMTVNQLLDLYLHSSQGRHSEITQVSYRYCFNAYARPYIGSLPLQKLNVDNMQNLLNFLLDKKKGEDNGNPVKQNEGGRGLSPNTVRKLKKVLSGAFSFAVKKKFIVENPISGVELPPIRKSVADSMSIEEAITFSSVKDNFWFGNAFVFQLHTGLRPQELMALFWEDIDFEQGTVRIERACKWINGSFKRFGKTKNERGDRTIGLAPEQLDLLRAHRENQQKIIEECKTRGQCYGEPKIEEWVMSERPKQAHLYAEARLIFPMLTGRVPSPSPPFKEIKAMLRCAGITHGQTNYRWYDLRHTHATLLLSSGEPVHEVADRMGHSRIMLLSKYAHSLKSRLSSGAAVFAKLVPIKSTGSDPSSSEQDSQQKTMKKDTETEDDKSDI
jgi:integrase